MRKMGRKFVSALMTTALIMTGADFSALRVNAETENVLEISEEETSELE